MKKYLVSLIEETTYRKVIHADSKEEAETIMEEDVTNGGTSCVNSDFSISFHTTEYTHKH